MPNPENPDEAECRICFDTGTIPNTYNLCVCTGMRGLISQDLPTTLAEPPLREDPYSPNTEPEQVRYPTDEQIEHAMRVLADPRVVEAINVLIAAQKRLAIFEAIRASAPRAITERGKR